MKYIYLLLLGVLLTFALIPEKTNIKEANDSSKSVETASKAEPTIESVKKIEAPKWESLTLQEKLKLNPKKCNLDTEVMYESDGSCHKKTFNATVTSDKSTNKASGSGNCSLVNNYSGWDKRVAYAVCMAESGGNPNAANWNDNHGSCMGSFGLFQIGCIHAGASFDGKTNVETAYRLYKSSGWSPWTTYTSGKYLKYM